MFIYYINLLCMIKVRVRWCTCSLWRILGLLFCSVPPPLYFIFPKIQGMSSLPCNGNYFSCLNDHYLCAYSLVQSVVVCGLMKLITLTQLVHDMCMHSNTQHILLHAQTHLASYRLSATARAKKGGVLMTTELFGVRR